MQDLKITLVQIDQHWEDKKANLKDYDSLLEGLNTDLVLLPEMFQTGFTMNAEQVAEDWESSSSINWLKAKSKELDAAIYTSLVIKDNDNFFNRGVFIEPTGKVSVYNKRKTFGLAQEDLHYSSGSEETIVEFRNWTFQLQICYDLRFPEIVRNKVLSNQSCKYDVILYVANWPQKRSVHWNTLLRARAIENQCYVAAVNRIGLDSNQIEYQGDSQVVDLLGTVSNISETNNSAKTFSLSKDQLIELRDKLPFLKDQ